MPRAPAYPYETRLNIPFGPLEVIDEKAIADRWRAKWFNQSLCEVNDSVVRMGVVEGEYHWHTHPASDEFFYVVEGRFLVDLDGSTLELRPRQALVVPRGTRHRPRAPERTVILMIETRGIEPTGTPAAAGAAGTVKAVAEARGGAGGRRGRGARRARPPRRGSPRPYTGRRRSR